jgi:MFS family permease
MEETPRFTLHVAGDTEKTAAIVRTVTGKTVQLKELPRQKPAGRRATFADSPFTKRLIATSLTWFMIDVAFYGNGLSSHLTIPAFLPHASLLATTLLSLLIFAATALPGYYAAAWMMDTLGRRSIQSLGFVVMAAAYVAIAASVHFLHLPALLLVIYGVSYFFIEFGPNTTTFIYPSEAFPTHLRGLGHGIAAAVGKAGAFIAAFLFPVLLQMTGLPVVFLILAATSLIGAWLTLALLPEPKRRALEELNGYLSSTSVHHTYTSIMQSLHEEGLGEAVCEELHGVSGADLVVLHQLDEEGRVLRPSAWSSALLPFSHFASRLVVPRSSSTQTKWRQALPRRRRRWPWRLHGRRSWSTTTSSP